MSSMPTPPPEGEYTLRRQRNGSGYFGHVRVELRPGGTAGPPSVAWAVPAEDRASIGPREDAEFVAAAITGARDGVRLARALGATVDGWAVDIVRARLSLTDIEESAVRTAAAMAVGAAFGVRHRLHVRFESGWYVARDPVNRAP
ncbi:hypothetical protein [Nocardiopsis sp. NRRL B-16309]|uniref:hypothetical protein n=1 Tax=Nocardiopsis sp. NRRL B-16309 TaxID=1519494 RepID=UPI0006AF877F|nr:hypothetical protein [Nocardiopsis sp. NRRL B-16309]KOX13605.1 hypothetical protein ADL05_19055 [Nocardiopsis sp. NRRL B-16309]